MFEPIEFPANDPELGDLKAQWIESIRPIVAMTPKSQRDSTKAQLLETMICSGWTHEDATATVEKLFA